jgi:hypothetical protein
VHCASRATISKSSHNNRAWARLRPCGRHVAYAIMRQRLNFMMPAFHPSLPPRALPLANCSEMLWMAALECQHETVARGYSTTLHRGESPRWCERCAELVSFLRVFCLTMRRAGMPHRDPGR